MPVDTYAAAEPRASPKAYTATATSTATMRCLIVARNERQRRFLSRAAAEAGWETVPCQSAEEACRQSKLSRCAFAMIDVDIAGDFGDLSESTVQRNADRGELGALIRLLHGDQVLVAVCIVDGDSQIELWARCLGVWACLPDAVEGCDLSAICQDAKIAARQIDNRAVQQAVVPW